MSIKSIHEVGGVPPQPTKSNWIHRWETRTKIITCCLMVFGLVSLKSPPLLMLAWTCLFIMVLSMGMTLKQVLLRISWILPFLLLMSASLLISGGFPPSQERIHLILLLIFKSLSALLLMLILFFSQPIPAFFTGLSHMKLPSALISILFLSWRYLFLFWEKLIQIHRALRARLFRGSLRVDYYRTYGEIIGGMIVKSIDGSDKIYRAMASRGFNGRVPTGNPQKITCGDLLISCGMLFSVILLHIIEKWRF